MIFNWRKKLLLRFDSFNLHKYPPSTNKHTSFTKIVRKKIDNIIITLVRMRCDFFEISVSRANTAY